MTCDFQQCGILTSVYPCEPVQPPFRLRNSKYCSVISLILIEFSSDLQRLWSDCAYAQTDLRLCGSHVPQCWKSHVVIHMFIVPQKGNSWTRPNDNQLSQWEFWWLQIYETVHVNKHFCSAWKRTFRIIQYKWSTISAIFKLSSLQKYNSANVTRMWHWQKAT